LDRNSGESGTAERSTAARPGIAPGVPRTAGPLFAALYGELVPHAWRAAEPEQDAYSLFLQRSLALGWLDDRSIVVEGDSTGEHPLLAPGLWAMNDAGWTHPLAAPGAHLVSWFQVEASAVAVDRPLPVQPFLRCAVDTTTRVGTLTLSAVQVLLPVQGLDPSARPRSVSVPSLHTTGWFAECDPRSRTAVEINVNSGRDPSVTAVARELADHLGRLEQDVFACHSCAVAGLEAVLPPPFDDAFWNGPPLHGVVLRGELLEWSCEAIGWLAETVADIAAGLGVRSPLLFTVTRTSSRS